MSEYTIIRQGTFTSDGSETNVFMGRNVEVQWIKTVNLTQSATQQATGRGIEFYWQKQMASDSAIETKKLNASDTTEVVQITSGGFTPVNTATEQPGPLNSTITAISTAATPVVSLTSTAGLSNGDRIRLFNVANASQLGGVDFEIANIVANTSFELVSGPQLAVAGGAGSLRKVDTVAASTRGGIFRPTPAQISGITQAVQAVVTLTTNPDLESFEPGSIVRFNIPSLFGMTELDGLQAEVVSRNTTTNTVTFDIDTSGFSAFTYPTDAQVVAAGGAFTSARAVPIALDSSVATQSAVNDADFIAMFLAGGAQSPAGSSGDVIFWQAGISFDEGVRAF